MEVACCATSQKEVGKEGKVNINTATAEELKQRDWGEKKAEAIIEYRKKKMDPLKKRRADESEGLVRNYSELFFRKE